MATVREQRREILILLEENPSVKPYLEEALALAYQGGLDFVVRETGLSYAHFPEFCPYTWEQTLDPEFFRIENDSGGSVFEGLNRRSA